MTYFLSQKEKEQFGKAFYMFNQDITADVVTRTENLGLVTRSLGYNLSEVWLKNMINIMDA